jgi:hypothetical protein
MVVFNQTNQFAYSRMLFQRQVKSLANNINLNEFFRRETNDIRIAGQQPGKQRIGKIDPTFDGAI